ncbi:GNAT family N-acetyltransferase [Streptomyces cynarae]|uniref:GNAT family N-acetyltransferase n=1 Tax=Streptomyces cynarae TaxID=2981134 RepID=UPI00406C94E5
MYAISPGDDGAELRPLEPWHAEEFLAHLERGREFITRHIIRFGEDASDVDSAREILKGYADKRAADTGFLHGCGWTASRLAFDERGMHRVEWCASSADEPGINGARRLGMTREGVLREAYPHRGVRQDIEVWSVLAPEWSAARACDDRDDHQEDDRQESITKSDH